MVNVIAILILAALIGWAVYYIYKEKKKGTRCIGCPMAGNCAKSRACSEASKNKL